MEPAEGALLDQVDTDPHQRSSGMTPKRIRVLCVDDNQALADALKMKLAGEPDLECIGTLPSADDLAARAAAADIVLLDIEMPGRDTFQALRDLLGVHPDVRVIILSAHVRDEYVDAAVGAGVWGYLCKGDRPDEIVRAVRRVAAGEFVLGSEVLEHCKRGAWGGSRV
jgi:DNA-binding NarL/FixJ family response regulator